MRLKFQSYLPHPPTAPDPNRTGSHQALDEEYVQGKGAMVGAPSQGKKRGLDDYLYHFVGVLY